MSGSSATTDWSSGDAMRRGAVPVALASATRAVSVPAMNHSVRGASRLASKATCCDTTPCGGCGVVDAVGGAYEVRMNPPRGAAEPTRPGWSSATSLRCSASITERHTGAAPLTPDTACIGAPLALPTHTPTV